MARLIKKQKQAEIDQIIQRAVQAGLAAGRSQAEQTARDAYRATERRLYALPTLIKKVDDARERLEDLLSHGPHERSKDVLRFAKTGVRLSADEIVEAVARDIRAGIAADEEEIATVKKALEQIESDPYCLAVKGRYFEQISDEEIAKQIPCDPSTVRRNRGRLVRVLAVWFYGAGAV